MKSTRLRSSRSALLPIVFLMLAVVFWPAMDAARHQSGAAQNVSWLGSDSSSYLTSSGIPVLVPSWLPGPVAGASPEIYAGGGSYSIYFYAGSSLLYITGVAGAGYPGGSEANLNVPLSINTSVQGYDAIRDLGIPEGGTTPIYDKVMWIAGGVLYTVSGNGLDSDSLTIANSSVVLSAPTPTNPPAPQQPSQPETSDSTGSTTTTETGSTGSTTGSTTTSSSTSGTTSTTAAEPTAASLSDDGTGGAWFTGGLEVPSDGTAGALPPFLTTGDGTGGPP